MRLLLKEEVTYFEEALFSHVLCGSLISWANQIFRGSKTCKSASYNESASYGEAATSDKSSSFKEALFWEEPSRLVMLTWLVMLDITLIAKMIWCDFNLKNPNQNQKWCGHLSVGGIFEYIQIFKYFSTNIGYSNTNIGNLTFQICCSYSYSVKNCLF